MGATKKKSFKIPMYMSLKYLKKVGNYTPSQRKANTLVNTIVVYLQKGWSTKKPVENSISSSSP